MRVVNYCHINNRQISPVIEVRNVTKQFFNIVALNNVSLTIPKGKVIGLLGPNGAGKSTLFKIIAGVLMPDQGSVRPARGFWPDIAYKPDRVLFPNHLNVRDYLVLFSRLSNIPSYKSKRIIDESLEKVGLDAANKKRIGDLSKGMRQRLGLAQILIGDSPLLLLDEPSNGLDPAGQAEILGIINELRESGKTILISSHQLHEVTACCDYIVILNEGQVRYANSVEAALAVRPQVTITTDKDLTAVTHWLTSLHEDITVNGNQIVLGESATHLRRQLFTMLLGAGFDILKVDHSRTTLAEIYREALQ